MSNFKYHNVMKSTYVEDEDEVVEQQGLGWFIRMGFPGFNSRVNNAFGYDTKERALAAVRYYQTR